MMENWASYFRENKVDQCISGTSILLDKTKNMDISVYLEIGCGQLGNFTLHHSRLPRDGLGIGIDIRRYKEWTQFKPYGPANYKFLAADSTSKATAAAVRSILENRKVDFLFIDGNHDIKPVQKDWDNYSPLVREGGLIVLHDYDTVAYVRDKQVNGQGAAALGLKLKSAGYKIEEISPTSIGTALVWK